MKNTLHMLDFKEECEMYYWYGNKSYDSKGKLLT